VFNTEVENDVIDWNVEFLSAQGRQDFYVCLYIYSQSTMMMMNSAPAGEQLVAAGPTR
jgi:hypothetical protein